MIYPLDNMISGFMLTCIDNDTGELFCTEEEMQEGIKNLEMEFDRKIIGLRNLYLSLELDAKKVDAEAELFYNEYKDKKKRASSLHNRAERIKRFIAYLLQGEKFEKDGAKISYRKSDECVLDDNFTEWAIENAKELLKWEPRKTDVKEAIKSGLYEDIPAHIEERRNIQIK